MLWKRIIYSVVAMELLMVAIAAPVIHRRLKSPKAQEQSAFAGAPMLKALLAMPRPTNRVSRMQFTWDYDAASFADVDHFVLKIGTNSGTYTITESAGTNLSYVFSRTNWPEASKRHYMVVMAISVTDPDFDSIASNETHWPPFPPDHVMISWSTPHPVTRILSSSDIARPVSTWPEYAIVNDATNFSTNIDLSVLLRSFATDKSDRLNISLFNPNP